MVLRGMGQSLAGIDEPLDNPGCHVRHPDMPQLRQDMSPHGTAIGPLLGEPHLKKFLHGDVFGRQEASFINGIESRRVCRNAIPLCLAAASFHSFRYTVFIRNLNPVAPDASFLSDRQIILLHFASSFLWHFRCADGRCFNEFLFRLAACHYLLSAEIIQGIMANSKAHK